MEKRDILKQKLNKKGIKLMYKKKSKTCFNVNKKE